ncbi:hypothetical protein M9Y10_045395 [Tritrichomonas musculus]|uniref:Uncharacterized protein n=1 Tax=Tritrichomonas musculus TaxID=1915356 RepID=A0ABR2JV52_9EUKA
MEWGLNPLTSFESLDKIIANKSSTIEDVLKCDQIRGAFRRQHPALVMYLTKNLNKLADISLGIQEVESPAIQSAALFCLSNDAPVFTNQITTNKAFLTKLSDFLKNPNPKYNNLVAFYRIFKNCLEKSSGFMFINFPDKQSFIDNLVKMLDIIPIYLLVKDIATNCYPSVNQFLENCKAPIIFLNSASPISSSNSDNSNDLAKAKPSDRHNQAVLEILSDFVHSAPSLAKIMATDEVIDKLLSFVFNGTNKSSEKASILLHSIIILQDDVKSNQKLFLAASNHLAEKLSDLCSFVEKEGKYISSRSKAMEVITYLLSKMPTIPDSAINLCKFLSAQIYLQPVQSFLHINFYNLFTKICDKTNIIEITEIQKVILEKIADYHKINANYFGILFKLAGVIENSPKKIKDDKWDQFIKTTYKEWTTIVNASYGGPLPIQKTDSSSSYEYEYEEEDEEDEEDEDEDEEEEETDTSSTSSSSGEEDEGDNKKEKKKTDDQSKK